MKDDELKNIWNMINDDTLGFEALHMTKDQIISNRSGSVQNKLRAMLQNDLILKLVSGIALLLNLVFYWGTSDVILICFGCILFLGIITSIQWKTLQAFDRISNPGLSTRESLSNILIFIKRKANIYEICLAASQVLVYVPGLLIYFYLVYGQVKPMTGMSFAVFTTLALIGTFSAYARIRAQIKFHIQYLHISLSDLNENSLQYAFNAIDNKRKQDNLLKTLVYILAFVGFIAIMVVLKSALG
jgi:hypothetical protein